MGSVKLGSFHVADLHQAQLAWRADELERFQDVPRKWNGYRREGEWFDGHAVDGFVELPVSWLGSRNRSAMLPFDRGQKLAPVILSVRPMFGRLE